MFFYILALRVLSCFLRASIGRANEIMIHELWESFLLIAVGLGLSSKLFRFSLGRLLRCLNIELLIPERGLRMAKTWVLLLRLS